MRFHQATISTEALWKNGVVLRASGAPFIRKVLMGVRFAIADERVDNFRTLYLGCLLEFICICI